MEKAINIDWKKYVLETLKVRNNKLIHAVQEAIKMIGQHIYIETHKGMFQASVASVEIIENSMWKYTVWYCIHNYQSYWISSDRYVYISQERDVVFITKEEYDNYSKAKEQEKDKQLEQKERKELIRLQKKYLSPKQLEDDPI